MKHVILKNALQFQQILSALKEKTIKASDLCISFELSKSSSFIKYNVHLESEHSFLLSNHGRNLLQFKNENNTPILTSLMFGKPLPF